MDNLFLSLFAVLLILVALALGFSTLGRQLTLSPLFGFVVVSIVFVNIGFLIRFFDSTEDWAVWALMTVTLGLFAASTSGAFAFSSTGMAKRWSRYSSFHLEIDVGYGAAVITLLLLIGLVSIKWYFVGYVPLVSGMLAIATSGFTEGLVNTLRINADPLFNPDAEVVPFSGLFDVVRNLGAPICAVWFLHFRRLGIHPKLSLVMIMCSAFVVISSGQRWPFMYMLLTLLFYWSWNEVDTGKTRKAIAKVATLGAIVGIAMSALLGRKGEEGLDAVGLIFSGAGDLLERLIMNQSSGPFPAYAIFSDPETWLHGGSYIQNIMSLIPGRRSPGAGGQSISLIQSIFELLPEKQYSFPVTFYEIVQGKQAGFTAPPDLYTEAFLNFGFVGAIFLAALWACVLVYYQSWLISRRTLGKQAYDCTVCTCLAFSAISGPIYVINAVIAIAVVIALHGIARCIVAVLYQGAFRMVRS